MRSFDMEPRPTGDDAAFDVVAVGSSAGGVHALMCLLQHLPSDFPAAVMLAQHHAAGATNILPMLLGARSRLPVKEAAEGEPPRRGVVYLPPAGRHLAVRNDGRFCVSRSERIDFVRPSADLLFESVAERYGERAVAVVLTGMGRDGSRGVRAIRRRGGFVIAQDAWSAKYFDMPEAAIETAQVDLVLPLRRMSFALTTLVMGEEAALASQPAPGPVGRALQTEIAWDDAPGV